jgi:hypothetical protein
VNVNYDIKEKKLQGATVHFAKLSSFVYWNMHRFFLSHTMQKHNKSNCAHHIFTRRIKHRVEPLASPIIRDIILNTEEQLNCFNFSRLISLFRGEELFYRPFWTLVAAFSFFHPSIFLCKWTNDLSVLPYCHQHRLLCVLTSNSGIENQRIYNFPFCCWGNHDS